MLRVRGRNELRYITDLLKESIGKGEKEGGWN